MSITKQELIKKARFLKYSEDEINKLLNKDKTEKGKGYQPSKHILDRLECISKRVEGNISGFFISSSPFRHLYLDVHMTQIIKWHFSFTNRQLKEMDENTKYDVIERGLIGIKKAIKQYRDLILDEYQMFEDRYEQEKLKYLMKHGNEPQVFTENDYEHIEIGYMMVLREALLHYFEIKVNKNYKGLSVEYSNYLVTKFWLHCLKRFEQLKVMDIIQWRLLHAIETGNLYEIATDTFNMYKSCPISSFGFTRNSYDDNHLYTVKYILEFQLYRYVLVFKNIEHLHSLMEEVNFHKMVQSILALIEYIKELTQNKSFKEIFKMKKEPEILKGYTELVKCLPTVISILGN